MRFTLLVLIPATLWFFPTAAVALSCPAGYQELSSFGTHFGCIQTATNAGLKWALADDACFSEGARLPTYQEWRSARTNLTLSAPPNTPGQGDVPLEWTRETYSNGPPNFFTQVNFDGLHFGPGENITPFPYRCFKPAQGHQLSILPTGPWWLTIPLLGTGVALQWNYFRKREASS